MTTKQHRKAKRITARLQELTPRRMTVRIARKPVTAAETAVKQAEIDESQAAAKRLERLTGIAMRVLDRRYDKLYLPDYEVACELMLRFARQLDGLDSRLRGPTRAVVSLRNWRNEMERIVTDLAATLAPLPGGKVECDALHAAWSEVCEVFAELGVENGEVSKKKQRRN